LTTASPASAVPIFTDALLFNLGLGFCITAGIADNDVAVAATGIVVNFSISGRQ